MGDGERFVEEAVKLAVRGVREGRRLARRRKRAQRRLLKRTLFTIMALVVATAVIVPGMIAAGLFLGPTGAEGLLLTPLLLVLSWSLIVYLGLIRRPRPVALLPQGTAIAALPERTDAWLEVERAGLPWAAQNSLDAISVRLEGLSPRLQGTAEDRPAAIELRRLLGEELPQLVNTFRKVPSALAKQPLYGGATPERQLVDGLATIDRELQRLEGELAQDDMHALATHQRYLELKYNRKDGIE
jgi:hypothetical protein